MRNGSKFIAAVFCYPKPLIIAAFQKKIDLNGKSWQANTESV
jgi:hypothetical protein